MAFPKLSEWNKFDAVQNAGTRGGFNPLRDLEKIMQENIPDLRNYNLCFSSEGDINQNSTMGWILLKTEHFDVEDWNREIGTRYNLHTDGGANVMYGGNYLMIMHKKHREKILEARLDALNEQNAIAKSAGAYAHPQDPNRGEMLQGAAAIANKDSEKYRVQAKGTPTYDDVPPAEEKKSGGLFSKKNK
jgi:hypothetical protein